MGQTIHVVPIEDLIDHDSTTTEPDCVCGPTVEQVKGDNGDGWLIVHHSLDGRELREIEEDKG